MDKFWEWLWVKTHGLKPWNGQMWLTPRMQSAARKLTYKWRLIDGINNR